MDIFEIDELIEDLNNEVDVDINLLIDQVKIRPVLYVKKLNQQANLECILAKWLEISHSLDLDIESEKCIQIFVKLLKIFQSIHSVRYKPWVYYEKLLFLANLINDELIQSIEVLLETSDETIYNNNIDDCDDDDDGINNNDTNIYNPPVKFQNDLFLLSCAPILARLSPRKNALARLEILKLLYRIENNDLL